MQGTVAQITKEKMLKNVLLFNVCTGNLLRPFSFNEKLAKSSSCWIFTLTADKTIYNMTEKVYQERDISCILLEFCWPKQKLQK